MDIKEKKGKGAKVPALETVMDLKSVNSLCKLNTLVLIYILLATITAITPILSSEIYKMARTLERNDNRQEGVRKQLY